MSIKRKDLKQAKKLIGVLNQSINSVSHIKKLKPFCQRQKNRIVQLKEDYDIITKKTIIA